MIPRRGLLKASLPILAAPAIIRVASLMRISPHQEPVILSASHWGRSNIITTGLESGTMYFVMTDSRRPPDFDADIWDSIKIYKAGSREFRSA